MIVVIEGISASGKTSWCRANGGEHVVPENGSVAGAPNAAADPVGAAAFWSHLDSRRWRAALAMEAKSGLAICDTDPLKLHYTWCLLQIGDIAHEVWREQKAAAREALVDGRVGFADAYFVNDVDDQTARLRRDGDTSRTRRNFEKHVRMRQPLLVWYQALAQVLPRVTFGLPDAREDIGAVRRPSSRYDVAMFDRMIALLPSRLPA
jgi:hypothetical protein